MANPKLKSVTRPSQNSNVIARRKPAATVKTAYSLAEREEIFHRFSVQRPEPRGELEHSNPFTLVVAVALSAQATDVGVNKATRALFKVADTPEKMLELGEERLRDYIRTIGLYRNKAKNVIALSQMLVDDFAGKVPETRDELVKLPGVGRKTANVVLSMGETLAEKFGFRHFAENIVEDEEGRRVVLGFQRRRMQALCARIVEDDILAAVGLAGEIAAPES